MKRLLETADSFLLDRAMDSPMALVASITTVVTVIGFAYLAIRLLTSAKG